MGCVAYRQKHIVHVPPKKGSWVGHSRPTCSHYQILPWLHSQVWCNLDLSLETGSIFRVEMACVYWHMALGRRNCSFHESADHHTDPTMRHFSLPLLLELLPHLDWSPHQTICSFNMKCPASLQGSTLRLVVPWGCRTANGQLDSGQGSVLDSLGRTELRSLLLRKNSQTQWRLDKNSGFDYQIMGLMGGK